MTADRGDDGEPVPVSIRLGDVVPPEDPEDWTRPLTWVAALGMLLPAAIAAGWVWLARPTGPADLALATYAVALAVVAGAALTGATQQGRWRRFAATFGAGLFASLAIVIAVAGADADARGHVVLGAASGVAGAAVSALTMAAAGHRWRRGADVVLTLSLGAAVSAGSAWLLLSRGGLGT